MVVTETIKEGAELIVNSKNTIAFTGAGISVESGIPPFRGKNGIWNTYDPQTLELNYFYNYPESSWEVIRELFYKFFAVAKPNNAHQVLAQLGQKGLLNCVITQNIDNLHQLAGSKIVHEFHGNSQVLICTKCKKNYTPENFNFTDIPPQCKSCDGLIKPNFIFFGEDIPMNAYEQSVKAASKAELVILIGTTGEVFPAAQIPHIAKQNGAKIIEVNPEKSNFTNSITDIFMEGKATQIMEILWRAVLSELNL